MRILLILLGLVLLLFPVIMQTLSRLRKNDIHKINRKTTVQENTFGPIQIDQHLLSTIEPTQQPLRILITRLDIDLPIIEAQACGVPVVTTDYAAGPELVGSGFTVKASDYVIMNTPGTRYALPDIDGMASALTKIYNGDPEKMARRARMFALRYDWDRVFKDYFNPILEKCESELFPYVYEGGVVKWA